MKKLLFAFPIVALLAVGCNSTQRASVQTQDVQNPSPTPTPSSINTSGWKVYNNPLGFSVKSPPDYTYITEADNSMDFNSPDGNVAVHIDGINNPQKLDLQTFYSKFDETFSNGSDSPYATSTAQNLSTNINGYQELKFPNLANGSSTFPSDFTPKEKLALTPSEQVSVNLGQLVVELTSTNSTKPDEANSITDAMANSVNVAPITIPTSSPISSNVVNGLETYTNTKYGFTLQYPDYWQGAVTEYPPQNPNAFSRVFYLSFATKNSNPLNPPVYLNIYPDQTADSIIKQYDYDPKEFSKTLIGGVVADSSNGEGSLDSPFMLLFSKNGFGYILGCQGDPQDVTATKQLIATFEFTK